MGFAESMIKNPVSIPNISLISATDDVHPKKISEKVRSKDTWSGTFYSNGHLKDCKLVVWQSEDSLQQQVSVMTLETDEEFL